MHRLLVMFFVVCISLMYSVPSGTMAAIAAGPHDGQECKGIRHIGPPPGNPWQLLPGVQEHFLQLGCYFHRQPQSPPSAWEFGTCKSCHSAATPAEQIPLVQNEVCASCHYAATGQQVAAPCPDEWCPIYIRPVFASNPSQMALEWYIAGMNLNPRWH